MSSRRLRWRPWLRSLHRDIGYLAIGLTLVYAVSGLAVNHIADWDPNFHQIDRTHQLTLPLPDEDQAAAARVLSELGDGAPAEDVYRISASELEVVANNQTFHINTETGAVRQEGQKPRFLIRAANWLHLNRGKKAWTYIADGYALFLLFLAVSGLFMLPGGKRLFGRRGLLVSLGVLIPVLYVAWSGGP